MNNEQQKPSPIERFWLLLKPDKLEITNIYVYAIFNGIVYLSLPLGIQAIINLIQGGQMSTSWILLITFVIAGIATTGILQIFQLRITENLQQKIFTRAAFEFTYRLPRIKLEALYKHYAPELMNRFFDTLSVQKGLSKILIDFSAGIVQVAFGLVLLSFYHPFFILFSFILVLLVYSIFKFTFQKGMDTSLQESKYKYKVVNWLQELARTNTTFKLAGKTDLPLNQTNKEADSYLEARENHFRILMQQYSMLIVFKVLIATGLLAIGGILVMDQQMNIGQFVAAEIIILLVMSSVEKLVLNMEVIYDVLTSLEKIGEVTDLEMESTTGLDITASSEEKGLRVQLENLDFNYPSNSKKVLQNINLTIEANSRIMICGNNGSGKSTLLYLIAGLYDFQQGNISYNGFPKGNLEPTSLRGVIGDCLMEEQLFQGTILDNITIGRKSATFENALWAVKHVGLEGFIQQSPMGFDTLLNSEGKNLSKSTIQKLLLARSIVHKPKLLILNDSFSHLEKEERNRIVDFLIKKENKWTLVMSSSDAYIADSSDKIVLMKNGSIHSVGKFEDQKTKFNFNKN
ncbi:MAG: ATP-binding cassette domain-containing protein [Bacteroidota bacterium]|nr:ATP-binding cassette domain-containing protein [Bacteroidota bacterium]